jgi:hypothetical protein
VKRPRISIFTVFSASPTPLLVVGCATRSTQQTKTPKAPPADCLGPAKSNHSPPGWVRKLLPLLLVALQVPSLARAFEPFQVAKAQPADAFVDSIGVNVHLSYFDTAYSNFNGVVKPRLLEAGIRHIRDGCPSQNQTEFQNRLNDLGRTGIKSMLICSPHTGKTPPEVVGALKRVSASVEAVEGPNETDGAGINYQGQGFPEGTRAFQDDLFAAVKSDPDLAGLPVVIASISDPEKAPKLGRLNSADFANTHSYAGGGPPGFRWNWYLDRCLTNIQRPIIASETGYHTATHHIDSLWICGVSEAATGKYLSRLFPEYFLRGIVRTYVYEFLNEKPVPDNSEANFGLLRCDGEPKPAFTAIRNLIALLKDPGPSFAPGTLEFSVNGDTEPVRSLLLQKRDARFYLLLWMNAVSYDTQAKRDIEFTSQPTRIVFAKPLAWVQTYQPLNSSAPLKRADQVSEVLLRVPDHVVVLEIQP